MPYVVVVDEKLVGYFLMADGTDGSEELIGIKGIELRLEELRTENILVAEGGCTDVEDGVAPHVGKARLPSLHEGIEPDRLQSHLLQEYRILGVSLLLSEDEKPVETLVKFQGNGGDFLDKLRVHLLLVLLEPVIFSEVNTGGITHTGNTFIVSRTSHIGWTSTQRWEESGLQLLSAVVLHLLHEGVYGISTCHGFRLIT